MEEVVERWGRLSPSSPGRDDVVATGAGGASSSGRNDAAEIEKLTKEVARLTGEIAKLREQSALLMTHIEGFEEQSAETGLLVQRTIAGLQRDAREELPGEFAEHEKGLMMNEVRRRTNLVEELQADLIAKGEHESQIDPHVSRAEWAANLAGIIHEATIEIIAESERSHNSEETEFLIDIRTREKEARDNMSTQAIDQDAAKPDPQWPHASTETIKGLFAGRLVAAAGGFVQRHAGAARQDVQRGAVAREPLAAAGEVDRQAAVPAARRAQVVRRRGRTVQRRARAARQDVQRGAPAREPLARRPGRHRKPWPQIVPAERGVGERQAGEQRRRDIDLAAQEVERRVDERHAGEQRRRDIDLAAQEVEAGEQRRRDIDLVEEEVERRRRRHAGEQRRRGPYYGAMRPDEFQRQKSPLTWETPNARLEAEQDMRDSPRPVEWYDPTP